jgi:hypothetical protein
MGELLWVASGDRDVWSLPGLRLRPPSRIYDFVEAALDEVEEDGDVYSG